MVMINHNLLKKLLITIAIMLLAQIYLVILFPYPLGTIYPYSLVYSISLLASFTPFLYVLFTELKHNEVMVGNE